MIFPQCYTARTRTKYDGSNCCFNLCCFGIPFLPCPQPAIRNIIREGYGIEGNCINDLCVLWCCPCWAAIQLRQEVNIRENLVRVQQKAPAKKKAPPKKKPTTELATTKGKKQRKDQRKYQRKYKGKDQGKERR